MKKIVLINASPRKAFNTATMLNYFGEGAKRAGDDVEVRRFDLYDYDFTGCRECFLCKMMDSGSYEQCGYPDDLHEILEETASADVVAFGTPIFLGSISGMMQAFMERLLYPFLVFDKQATERKGSFCRPEPPKKLRAAFIYTMNVTKEDMERFEYPRNLVTLEKYVKMVFGYAPKVVNCCNTYQFDDYSKYVADSWDLDDKADHLKKQFPADCVEAAVVGYRLAMEAAGCSVK